MKVLKVLAGMLIVALLLLAPGFYQALAIRTYDVEMADTDQSVWIALITDLHSSSYGDNMIELINAIHEQSPDVILLGGDIFDDVIPDDNTAILFQGIASNYPCYYVTGNHEYWDGAEAFLKKMDILDNHGVARLAGEVVSFEVKGQTIYLAGIDDPDEYLIDVGDTLSSSQQMEAISQSLPQDGLTILLSHRPELIDWYERLDVDLILSGHAHGGQWRIPGILNGVFAPNQGFFPKYAGGQYALGDSVFIVSRGLAKESTRVPRIYNRPELVIINLN